MTMKNYTTKQDFVDLFSDFSKSSIKIDADGLYLYGHNVNVAIVNGVWDVYLCNQKEYAQGNLTAYLGTGKLNNICSTLPETINIHNLDGERWFQTKDTKWLKSWLLSNRTALGIAKRINRDKSTYRGFKTAMTEA